MGGWGVEVKSHKMSFVNSPYILRILLDRCFLVFMTADFFFISPHCYSKALRYIGEHFFARSKYRKILKFLLKTLQN